MDWYNVVSDPNGRLDKDPIVKIGPVNRGTRSTDGCIDGNNALLDSMSISLLPNDIPSWVHIYQEKKTSSKQTQAASIAHIVETESLKSLPCKVKSKRNKEGRQQCCKK